MRRRVVIGGILAGAAVIVVGWEAGEVTLPSHQALSSPAGHAGADGSSATGSSATRSAGPSPADTAQSASGAYRDGTYTGSTVSTRFGNVQVRVQVSGGDIAAVTPLRLTDRDRRSVMISQHAAALLQQEALAAQSASVDSISGATYTSEGYRQSLQAALDQAQ